jgi:hypothetical protein
LTRAPGVAVTEVDGEQPTREFIVEQAAWDVLPLCYSMLASLLERRGARTRD